MEYMAALKSFTGNGTVDALREYLLAVSWPNKAPTLHIGPDPNASQAGEVRGAYDVLTHVITVRHPTGAAAKDILDTVLFEVGNALNPKITAAALPAVEPIGNVGASRGAAEYDTLKSYLVALVNIFGNRSLKVLPNLVAQTPDLPAHATRAVATWLKDFQPIYAAFGVQADSVFAAVPLSKLLPLPATVRMPASPPVTPDPLSAERAAVIQFCSTPHNPHADQAGEQFYLAHLNTIQVYAYERPRGWTQLNVTRYLENIEPLMASVKDVVRHPKYQRYRNVWAECDVRYRCYLFAWLMAELEGEYPQCVPEECVFDTRMIRVAREEAARGIAARYNFGDMKKVLPIKWWLTEDEDLLRLANKLFGALRPNERIDLSVIK